MGRCGFRELAWCEVMGCGAVFSGIKWVSRVCWSGFVRILGQASGHWVCLILRKFRGFEISNGLQAALRSGEGYSDELFELRMTGFLIRKPVWSREEIRFLEGELERLGSSQIKLIYASFTERFGDVRTKNAVRDFIKGQVWCDGRALDTR